MFELSKNTGSNSMRNSLSLLILMFLLISITSTPITSTTPINLAAPHPCGQSGSPVVVARMSRIIGGRRAIPGQIPWVVSLVRKKTKVHRCAGSLLTARHVLTAAHCLRDVTSTTSPEEWMIIAGDLSPRKPKRWGQVRQVQSIERHPRYKFPEPTHDLAILTLTHNVSWSALVQPVCLPGNKPEDFSAKRAELAGWGWLGNKGSTSDVLMTSRVPVMGNQECQDWLVDEQRRQKSLGKSYGDLDIQRTHICTGVAEVGSGGCKGDSGGPLTVLSDLVSTLVGVLAGGGTCGFPRVPSVYTRVSEYTAWLKNVTQ